MADVQIRDVTERVVEVHNLGAKHPFALPRVVLSIDGHRMTMAPDEAEKVGHALERAGAELRDG